MEAGYQVIARRWRPKQFDDVVGQDHIVRTLKNAILTERIAHAYLFVGPRGTGKTSMARCLAKALNCENGPVVRTPEDSLICQDIMKGNCMDVVEIDGASNNSVDQVRQLREDCQYAPAQCSYKIYIIDEVHMLSASAFNALLKTLEEPPPHVKFIFATTESQKILPTIVSRCQRFEFRPIPASIIVQQLVNIAEVEKIKVEEKALHSIARLADGGMRDAQSILDQLISFCGKEITEKDVLDIYGLASAEQVEAISRAIASANYEEIVARVDEIDAEGRDLYRVLLDLQDFVRAALLEAIRHKGKTDKLGATLSTESILRLLEALHAGESAVKTGLSEKVNFEITLLKAVEESRVRAIDSLIKEFTVLATSIPEEEDQKKNLISPTIEETVSDSDSTPEATAYENLGVSTSQVEEEEALEINESDADRQNDDDLDKWVDKIPASTKKLLEEKFNGKFVTVRSVSSSESE